MAWVLFSTAIFCFNCVYKNYCNFKQKKKKHYISYLGMLAHTLRSQLLSGSQFEANPKLARPHFNQQLGVVVPASHPSYTRIINRRLRVQADQGKKKSYPQNS
jgi:hypothetical protein